MAEFEAMKSGCEVDPAEFPEFEDYPTAKQAERRARSILRLKLDAFGCVMVTEEERDDSVSWEQWEPVRRRAMACWNGKIDWETDDWEPYN